VGGWVGAVAGRCRRRSESDCANQCASGRETASHHPTLISPDQIRLDQIRSGHITPHLRVRHLRDLLQIVLRPRGDLPDHHLLGCPAPQRGAHAVEQLLLGEQQVLVGQVLRVVG